MSAFARLIVKGCLLPSISSLTSRSFHWDFNVPTKSLSSPALDGVFFSDSSCYFSCFVLRLGQMTLSSTQGGLRGLFVDENVIRS